MKNTQLNRGYLRPGILIALGLMFCAGGAPAQTSASQKTTLTAAKTKTAQGQSAKGSTVSNGTNPSSGPDGIKLPDDAIRRQMIQLERAKHLLELSSVNQPASHNATAAHHLQSAINELKLELQENAKSKAAASAGQNLSANNKVTQKARGQ